MFYDRHLYILVHVILSYKVADYQLCRYFNNLFYAIILCFILGLNLFLILIKYLKKNLVPTYISIQVLVLKPFLFFTKYVFLIAQTKQSL